MNLGRRVSKWLYATEVLFPFAWVAGCAIGGVFTLWSLLTLPAIVPAWQGARDMLRHDEQSTDTIATLDERTAKLQLIFSLLFTLSFIIAALV